VTAALLKKETMNLTKAFGWSSALFLSANLLQAQETNDLESLRKQLQQATENFDRAMEEQRRVIEGLNKKIESLERAQTNAVPVANPPAGQGPGAGERAWQPSDPLRVRKGSAYMDIGLVGTFAAGSSTAKDIEGGTQLGGHDPNQRGFTLQGLEATFSGAVDPYFRGNANLSFSIDSGGESFLEVEEAWLETMSLPGNLQLRAGQIFTEFGRHNPTHLHTWSFVDAPLVNGRFLGPDGLRNPGARLSWLAPVPFFAELSLGVQNSQGETAAGFRSAGHGHGGEEEEGVPFAYRHSDNDRGLRSLGDLLFSPRYAMSFDLTESQVVLGGASAAFGPNSRGGETGGDTTTQIYGLDFLWKWKPVSHSGGFPFVSWQSEAMLRRYDAGAFDWSEEGGAGDPRVVLDRLGGPASLSGETLVDYGFYSQVLYGFKKGWVAGMRFDYAGGDRAAYERAGLTVDGEALGRDPERATRWRLSPNLTWYPTEFSKIRLQYNYDDRNGFGVDHSVWLQLEFLLGAHAAHKF
jgi:hypothetical protein